MTFSKLVDELARWVDAGLSPRLWLRDDDAVAPTPGLERLIALSAHCQAPVLLAVIAEPAQAALAERLADVVLLRPCQHGYAHRNHAGEGERAVELGGQRSLEVIGHELAAGRQRLIALFGDRLSRILVPPWNRIDENLVGRLPALGFSTLSTFGPPRFDGIAGLEELNCHVDLIDWRGGRVGKSPERLEGELVSAFALAREEGGRAVGFLTHHLAHDAQAWASLDTLCHWLAGRGISFADAVTLTGDHALSRS